ncbi:MAG: DUF5667 domain-containing protein, partial [Methanothrix sp.]|nr:DUF5667 domain-containing protein [Methanothrix sp.]
MIAVRLEEILEICLEKLEAGVAPEDILSSFPDQANELRPLLLAIVEGRQLAAEISPQPSAQTLSRAQFLTAAAGLAPAPRKLRFTLLHLRLATSSLIVVGILAAVLLGTGLASAAALPGDVFYPVKLMVEQIQLNIVQDPPARLELQENYDDRRLAEVERLNEIKRRQPVTFSGLLEQTGPDQWRVGTLPLIFSQGVAKPVGLNDAYVQITGYADNDSVEVESLQPRELQWSGILQKFDDQSWLIGGVTLLINDNTQMSGGTPQVGQSVQVTAIRLAANRYLALSLAVSLGSPQPVMNQPKPTISGTLAPIGGSKSCSEESDGCKPAVTLEPSPRPSDGEEP